MHKNFGNPWSHFPEKHRFVSFLAILGHFGTVWPKIRKTGVFGKNRALSLSSLYQVVTWCQVSEKSSEPFWRKWCEYLTDRLTVTSRGTSSPLGALGRVCLFSILLSCFRLKLNTVFFLFLPIFLLKLFNTCFTGWNCWVLIGTVGYWLELLGTDWNCWVLIGTVGYCLVLFGTVWNCLELFGTVWNSLELFGTVWYCLVLLGTV